MIFGGKIGWESKELFTTDGCVGDEPLTKTRFHSSVCKTRSSLLVRSGHRRQW